MAKKYPKEKKLTVERSMDDFRLAHRSRTKLNEREHEDFLFALGEQWSEADKSKLEAAGLKPITDNRIAPNIHLITGLERQNRTDFKAFPEGQEDGVKAEVASRLFRDSLKKSEFKYKSSDQFKEGVTCGESHLEFYLDYEENILNGAPKWSKCDGSMLVPDPTFREYDFSDARYVYRVKLAVSREDLIALFPEKRKLIEVSSGGTINMDLRGEGETHRQPRDYPVKGGQAAGDVFDERDDVTFDLLERYYKKKVARFFIADRQTGKLSQAESEEAADGFLAQYIQGIEADREAHEQLVRSGHDQFMATLSPEEAAQPMEIHLDAMNQAGLLPPPPPEQDPDRFFVVKRMVSEMWYLAHTPGIEPPLADEIAWFFPKWKNYPFVPYFARFSTAPLKGDERHLLIQGLVHGVKGVQEKHNKAEMLMLRHLNSSANSGWLSEENAWVDAEEVERLGAAPAVNLEYKQGHAKPERIIPVPISQAHAQIALDSAESIKAQLGINSDLLASQEGPQGDSGRAIALRQKQGLLMIQELFDNLTRSRQIAGRMLLSQFGSIYDLETALKVCGEAFLQKNFPPPMILDPENPGEQIPMTDPQTGKPMEYDKDMAEVTVGEVLSGHLEKYDVSVGESAASEAQQLAESMEIKEMATTYPGVVPPEILIRYSQIPESAKSELVSVFQQAQAAAQAASEGKTGGKSDKEEKKNG